MRLLPRDEKFFDLFTAVADLHRRGGGAACGSCSAPTAPAADAIVDQIKRLEHQADQVTHEVVTRLDRVFITPLDREDIHLLASRLDDVIDLIDGTARRLLIFHAGEAPQGAILIADVIVRAVEQLQVAVAGAGEEQGRHGAGRPASRSSGWRRRATRSTTNGSAGCSRASRTR